MACVKNIELIIGEDTELMDIWHSFEQVSLSVIDDFETGCSGKQQGYLQFHIETRRYKLTELTLS